MTTYLIWHYGNTDHVISIYVMHQKAIQENKFSLYFIDGSLLQLTHRLEQGYQTQFHTRATF